MRKLGIIRIGIWIIAIGLIVTGMVVQAQSVVPALPPAIAANDAVAAGKPLLEPQKKAAIITLHAEVNKVMRKSIERRLDIARKAGCTVVIYDIDTPGGLLRSALEISQLTKKIPEESQMATVAWVNRHAMSAGIFLTSACQHTVMANGGRMGRATPIILNPITREVIQMEPAERAKIQGPMLNDLEDSARRNNLNRTLLWAMVVPAIEIWELRNSETGEVKFVDRSEKDVLMEARGGKESVWNIVPQDGRIGPVDSDIQVLDVDAAMALRMGLSRATIDTEEQLRAALNIHGDMLRLDFNWAELATVFLTSFWIRSLLFVAMLVLAWIEFSHPGISVPGVLAAICLVLLVGAPFLTGLASVWEIALIIVGLGIIVVDFFLFGGFGLLAVPGFILMAVGLIASFVPAEPGGGISMPATWLAIRNGTAVVVFGSLISLVAFYFLSKYLHVTPGFRRLQLAAVGEGEKGREGERDDAIFVGAMGRATTDLRPAGKARLGGNLVDVVSHGSFIEQGTEVEVTEVSGNLVVVRPQKKTTDGGQAT